MKIISFFSFKGGVGRTALLTNLASYWATLGRVVALVDMDLAAPGISYNPLLEKTPIDPDMPPCGVSELLDAYYQGMTPKDPTLFGFFPPSRLLYRMRPPEILDGRWPQNGAILVLPAGTLSFQPLSKVEDGTLHHVPPKQGRKEEKPETKSWRAFAKLFREDMQAYRLETNGVQRPIDLLLIDCRTGWPELLDLSLGYLADHMVLVSGINQQNQEGLRHTLTALRKDEQEPRIPFGQYGTSLTVVFSPMPAHFHDDPKSQKSLAESRAILDTFRLPPPDDRQQQESLPPVYTLPYTTQLLHSDQPLYPSDTLDHPYILALLHIADRLMPEKDLTEEIQEIEKKLVRMGGKQRPQPENTAAKPNASEPKQENMVDLLHLKLTDKWYWPWFDRVEDPKAAGWEKVSAFLKEGEELTEVDIFLDALCASVSLGQDEKKEILEQLREMSDWQRQELVNIFHDERQKVESLEDTFSDQRWMVLAQRRKEWASLMLGEEDGWEQFFKSLNNPLKHKNVLEKGDSEPWNSLSNLARNPLNYDQDNEEEYRRATSSDETKADFWLHLGRRLQRNLNRPKEAEVAYRRAIELDEKDVRPWVNLGILYIQLNRFEESEKASLQAIELDKTNTYPWINLGGLYMLTNRPEEAEKSLLHAIKLDEKFATAWRNLGRLLNHLNRPAEAEAALRHAAELELEAQNTHQNKSVPAAQS